MVHTIAVIGAGQMGKGIAYLCAKAGFSVLLLDKEPGILEKALEFIYQDLEKQLLRQKILPEEKQLTLTHLKATSSLEECRSVDLLIESISEDFSEKKALFQQLVPILDPYTLLATTTSSFSITQLGTLSQRPKKFMGLHFMSPVSFMPLVELIKGLRTDVSTVEAMTQVILKLGKNYAESKDYPGFIVNRLIAPLINEAIYALYEGVGSLQSIDMAMRLGANQPMGPFEFADFIGLDVCFSILHSLYEGFADPKYRPCPLLVKYIDAGLLGRKTQCGFYDYTQSPPCPTY